MKTIFKLFLLVILFTSCNSDSVVDSTFHNQDAVMRTSPNMTISITKSDQSVINVATSHVKVEHISNNTFSVTVHYGSENAVTHTAVSALINEPDTKLKLAKFPHNIIYGNKSSCSITANAFDKLAINIQPGHINTNALTLVGDEQDGF